MSDMADKAQSDTGNKMIFIVNRKLWNDVQMTLGEYLANFRTDGTYMYSKSANKGQGGYVKVGATFDTYEYAKFMIFGVIQRNLLILNSFNCWKTLNGNQQLRLYNSVK